jgi:gliding motility-associated-like protein
MNPISTLSQLNQGFCYEPDRFVSDLNFFPYNSSEIQVFSEASNPNTKLDLVEKLISAPYYIKTKKVLINTTCYSNNFTTINVNVNKPALETETHFSNCGKKNGYIKLTSSPNNAIITWYKDNILLSDNSVALKGLDKGEFKIVINDNGCVRSKNIELNDCIPSEIPHIITPNNDSKNDLWVLGYYEKYPNVSVQIINRWGNKVFESDKPYKDNWDGKNMNGEFLPTGAYFYIIDKGNGEQVLSGYIEFVK